MAAAIGEIEAVAAVTSGTMTGEDVAAAAISGMMTGEAGVGLSETMTGEGAAADISGTMTVADGVGRSETIEARLRSGAGVGAAETEAGVNIGVEAAGAMTVAVQGRPTGAADTTTETMVEGDTRRPTEMIDGAHRPPHGVTAPVLAETVHRLVATVRVRVADLLPGATVPAEVHHVDTVQARGEWDLLPAATVRDRIEVVRPRETIHRGDHRETTRRADPRGTIPLVDLRDLTPGTCPPRGMDHRQ